MENEVEVLNHLLEVERAAATLAIDAKADADKKISAAKSKADAQFKVEFDKIVSENERVYSEKTEKIVADSEKTIKDYKEKISNSSKNIDEFNSYLDKILFA